MYIVPNYDFSFEKNKLSNRKLLNNLIFDSTNYQDYHYNFIISHIDRLGLVAMFANFIYAHGGNVTRVRVQAIYHMILQNKEFKLPREAIAPNPSKVKSSMATPFFRYHTEDCHLGQQARSLSVRFIVAMASQGIKSGNFLNN